MELNDSKLYKSSTLQANLLYRYLLEDLSRDLSEDFEAQWTESNQESLYLYSQTQIEVLVLPMSDCLEIISNPHPLLNNQTIRWENIQCQRAIRSSVGRIDIVLSELLFELSKGIIRESRLLDLRQKFIKILFPVEGMFKICVESDLKYFNCKVSCLITSEYQSLCRLLAPDEDV